MQTTEPPAGNNLRLREEIYALIEKVDKSKDPDPKDVQHLHQLALATPGFLSFECSATQSIRHHLIEKISHGVSRACLLAEVDMLKGQLDYDAAPPLERLLIDHILTVRLRLIHAENAYNSDVVNKSISLRVGEYWDGVLSAAQARYLRAIETLARVRRLARNTPALQINIAEAGGKQVNLQGGGKPHSQTPTAEGK
jgi:hypothetical protein